MIYKHFLYWILGKSCTVSLLILIILIFKLLFRDKLSSKWHYYIWFLVFIQLITPYAIESRFKFLNTQNYTLVYEWITNGNHISDSIRLGTINLASSSDDNEFINHTGNLDSITESKADVKQTAEDKLNHMVSLASRIWLMGLLVLLAYNILVYHSLSHALKKGKQTDNKAILEVIKVCKLCMNLDVELKVVETPIVTSPSVIGVMKPKLLLPPEFYTRITEDEFYCVVYHELSHIKRKDLAIQWFIKVFSIIHWFNPIIWYGFHRMSEDNEIACDAYSLSFIEKEKHKDYGNTIIRLLEIFSQTNPIYPIVGMTKSKLNIKRRIERIKSFGKPSSISIMAAITLLLIASSLLLRNPLEYSSTQNMEPTDPKFMNVSDGKKYSKELLKASTDIKKLIENSAQDFSTEYNHKMKWPILNSGLIATSFGECLYQNELLVHPGLDILSKYSADVIAAEGGEVIYAGYYSVYGQTVIINHGNKTAAVYGQLNDISVKKNEHVKSGEKIGTVGQTGHSDVPHLHFELRKDGEPVNPLTEYKLDAIAPKDSPGLTIIMADGNLTEGKTVLERITNKLVNELFFAGAEGIYINDEPIALDSRIRCAGPVLKINDKPIVLPYTIKAIGESQKLCLLLNDRTIEDEVKKAGVVLSIAE